VTVETHRDIRIPKGAKRDRGRLGPVNRPEWAPAVEGAVEDIDARVVEVRGVRPLDEGAPRCSRAKTLGDGATWEAGRARENHREGPRRGNRGGTWGAHAAIVPFLQ